MLVSLIGLLVFSCLNYMMLQMDPTRFTNPRLGVWTAFHTVVVSGFDPFVYYMTTEWAPRYEVFRHPLLFYYLWPLAELNTFFKDTYRVNCTIYIVACLWTMISTVSWTLLYRFIRNYVRVTCLVALLLTMLFFGFSHVMITTFFPDHMILTLFSIMIAINVMADSVAGGKKTPIWKTLLIYMFSAGVTTTNSVKIWMADMVARYDMATSMRANLISLFRRSLYFLIPTALLVGAYFQEMNNAVVTHQQKQNSIIENRMKRDSVFAATIITNRKNEKAHKEETQLINSRFFAFTDRSVDMVPLLYENIFGEGILLHEDYLLLDANKIAEPGIRPVFVKYRHWWQYMVSAAIVCLSLLGVWCGRKQRILWLVLPMFLFDMLLHVVLRFAAVDVYIMTAHWAFVLPIAIAFLLKAVQEKRLAYYSILTICIVLTAFLWIHNLSLTYNYIIG